METIGSFSWKCLGSMFVPLNQNHTKTPSDLTTTHQALLGIWNQTLSTPLIYLN